METCYHSDAIQLFSAAVTPMQLYIEILFSIVIVFNIISCFGHFHLLSNVVIIWGEGAIFVDLKNVMNSTVYFTIVGC